MITYLLVWFTVCSALRISHRPSILRRRLAICSSNSRVDDKIEVEEYFNNEGFNRWNKIYSDSDEVNSVQRDIRTGHQQTVDKVLGWTTQEDNSKKTLCDAGCGVGSLAIPMATRFKKGNCDRSRYDF